MTFVITKGQRPAVKTHADLLKRADTLHHIFTPKGPSVASKARTAPKQDQRDGVRLGSLSDRRGAMDAFHLPSLHMGQRTYPKR